MIDMQQALYNRIKSVMQTWHKPNVYAVSFFVYSNECFEYRGFENVSELAISCESEDNCPGAGPSDEERWNYAYWTQDDTAIIDTSKSNLLTDMLFDWYTENGIETPGQETGPFYDENMRYIGKGPDGHYELLQLAASVARQLQEEGFIESKFGRHIPILIHGLEYCWYDIEATKKANPCGEADDFLKACEMIGFI